MRFPKSLRHKFSKLRPRRVPVVLQMNPVECGAACLAMILNYYGRQTRLLACREVLGDSRDGVTVSRLATTAQRFGLRTKAYTLQSSDLRFVTLPAIIHWNFNHFVVLESWSEAQAHIVDPAVGRQQLATAEFDASFTGVLLTLEPGSQFMRQRQTAVPSWLLYLKTLVNTPGTSGILVQIILASLFLQLFGLALPILTKILIDDVLQFQLSQLMPILGIGLLLLLLSQIITSYLRAALLIYLQARLDTKMMLGFFEHVLTLPFQFFQRRASGDLLMRLGSNSSIREMLTNQTISTVLDGSLVIVYWLILLLAAPIYSLIVLGVAFAQVLLLLGTKRRVHRLMEQSLAAQAASQSYLVEALRGIATLKASGAEERTLDHWSNLLFKHLNVSLRRSHLSAIIETAVSALSLFSPLVLLWVGALLVLNGSLSLGTMLALNALAVAFLLPLSALIANSQQLQLIGAHLDRLTDVFESEPEQAIGAVQNAPQLSGKIALKNVCFRYDEQAAYVLQNISLTVEPGQKVAIVGRSGSGKTTLAMLLLGLYTPSEGEILFDERPLASLDYRSLRRQFGVVLQESFLFSGSIRQNIAFNNPQLSLEQIQAAAQKAAVHDDIMQMPMGYETILAEGGSGLSGGQRQRLSLARAVANQPAILLLDEATSHLDVVTEQIVDANLNAISCTRLVIAHRLSTIRNADLILVLQEGILTESGSHDTLLAQQGHYATLVQN
jgi:ABC-type bacteriocin/lantibiotic exporter with double-glycine peptidase domain